MTNSTKNSLLSQACAHLRKERPAIPEGFDFSTRVEVVDGLRFATLWFRTQGCSHDRQGACTFCNYGYSSPVSVSRMIEYVRRGLDTLDVDANTILLITPSGSMFDEREVPVEARDAILRIVGQSKCRSFLCESRAETITEVEIERFARVLVNKNASIELGLESSNPMILKYCINKNLSLDDYCQAIKLLNKYDLGSSTTVMLGAAFLSAREAIEDTVETVRWAFRQGTERACIFPAHVKRWTLLEWLWQRNLYDPPSLWSLVEVLFQLGPELSPRVYTAWYKVYDQESGGKQLDPLVDMDYLRSPSTCEKCQPSVIHLLDEYRDSHSFKTIEELSRLDCCCKQEWKRALDSPSSLSLYDRILQGYEAIGTEIVGSTWWERYRTDVLGDLRHQLT